jgi:hypothetical protein
MFLIGWLILFQGLVRRNLLFSYYGVIETRSLAGVICRIWGWFHNASKDSEVADKPGFKWAFDLSEEVQIKGTKYIGMIWFRWIRYGWKVYEIKINNKYYVYYESRLAKTDLRVYSEVAIKEVKFKTLKEGHYTVPTKRWTPPTYPYCNYPMAYSKK